MRRMSGPPAWPVLTLRNKRGPTPEDCCPPTETPSPAKSATQPPTQALSLNNTLTAHTGVVWAVAVSADGRRAVSGGEDGTVRVWDLGAGGPPAYPDRSRRLGVGGGGQRGWPPRHLRRHRRDGADVGSHVRRGACLFRLRQLDHRHGRHARRRASGSRHLNLPGAPPRTVRARVIRALGGKTRRAARDRQWTTCGSSRAGGVPGP
jgi:WD domain, G-beta repeat